MDPLLSMLLRLSPLIIFIGINILVKKNMQQKQNQNRQVKNVNSGKVQNNVPVDQNENYYERIKRSVEEHVDSINQNMAKSRGGVFPNEAKPEVSKRPFTQTYIDLFGNAAGEWTPTNLSRNNMEPQILEPIVLEAEESLSYDKNGSDKTSSSEQIFDNAVSLADSWEKERREATSKTSSSEIFLDNVISLADSWDSERKQVSSNIRVKEWFTGESLRHAIIAKEILDHPVSMRR